MISCKYFPGFITERGGQTVNLTVTTDPDTGTATFTYSSPNFSGQITVTSPIQHEYIIKQYNFGSSGTYVLELVICNTCGSGQQAQIIEYTVTYGAYFTLYSWSQIVSFSIGLCSINCSTAFSQISATWKDYFNAQYPVGVQGDGTVPYPQGAGTMQSLTITGNAQVTDPLATVIRVQASHDPLFSTLIYDGYFNVAGTSASWAVVLTSFSGVYIRYRQEGGGLHSNWCQTSFYIQTPSSYTTRVQRPPLASYLYARRSLGTDPPSTTVVDKGACQL